MTPITTNQILAAIGALIITFSLTHNVPACLGAIMLAACLARR